MNRINLIRFLLLTSSFCVFPNTHEAVKNNSTINQFETTVISVVPVISTQPVPTLEVCLGDAIALSVVASPGTGTISYQWQKDGVDIGAETAADLNISVSTATDGGVYQCIVTDDDGSVTSSTSTVTVNTLPTIGITGNLIVCEDQTTTLTASGALKYDWGSGFTNVAAFDVKPSATSNYVVSGEDSNGCVASASVQVEVSPLPAASITSNGSVCSGADAQFIITGTPNAVVTYKLNSGVDTDVTLNNSGTLSVTIPTASSDQTLNLIKVANSTCETILSASETVLVNPIPTPPTVSSPITYCQDDIAIALSATGTDLKWYLASTSGAPLSEAPDPQTSNPGDFFYYVSQTINGCESPRAEVKVQVNVIPVISISGSDTICLGQSTTLTAAGDVVSYVWSPDGETTSSITVSPTSNTIYSVTGTDADGCSSSETLTVIVNAVPTASLSVSGPICSGNDAIFSITGSANATVVYSIDSGADQSVVLDSSGLASISETNQVS
ncbi:MAG: immunoglobulin domain-containing protein, partial [Flavobacteriaceae bacterium]|nr:immunoglobulin domain-containing protein [Flavobacteriaceae bacterium]